ncbi:MAG: TPM domain-containing protein [Lachnospiraceae bacterium]|nr:TPM domain-containing protein [Lachnospiraceae bacterium]
MLKRLRVCCFMALCALILFVNMPLGVHAEETVVYTNETTGYQVLIDERAGLFKDGELREIAEVMKELTQYGNVALLTIAVDSGYGDTHRFSENYLINQWGTSNSCMFTIDMDERWLNIETRGNLKKNLNNAKCNTITDNVYKMASKGNYYSCAVMAFTQMADVIKGERIAQPMKYTCNALLALVLALIIMYLYVNFVSRAHKTADKDLLMACEKHLNLYDVRGEFAYRSKKYCPRSSGGGGGGRSGGGSFGGGSHGGHGF